MSEVLNRATAGVPATEDKLGHPSRSAVPVSYSLVSAGDLLTGLGEAYELPARAECRLLRRGLHDTYLIAARQECYIVRVYRAGARCLDAVAYEIELLMHLASRDVSVSGPIPDRQGTLIRTLPALEGVRPVVLFTYAKGQRLSWSAPQSRMAGRLLAEIHTGSDDFVPLHQRAGLDLERLVDHPLAAVRRFLAHRPADWAYVVDFAARIRSHVAEVADDLEWGPCHGDFGAKNVHVDDAGRLTAFDFDRCGPGWRAIDFALIRWAAVGRRTPVMWESFLRGYQEVRRLASADLAVVPLFHALVQLGSLGLLAKYATTWGALRIDDINLDGWMGALRSWEREHSQLVAGEIS